MRIYRDLGAARLDAHPGVYIMVESTGPVWALMSVAERERVLNGGAAARSWLTVERARPFHDVAAEADTGWHDYDDRKTDLWHSTP